MKFTNAKKYTIAIEDIGERTIVGNVADVTPGTIFRLEGYGVAGPYIKTRSGDAISMATGEKLLAPSDYRAVPLGRHQRLIITVAP